MGYFCILLLFLISFLCYRKEKSIFSPSVSFSFLYAFVFLLSVSGGYGIYQAPDFAYELITLGVITFVMGAMVRSFIAPATKFPVKKIVVVGENEGGRLKKFNYWGMLAIVLIVICISAAMVFLFLITGGSVGDVYLIAAAATDGEDNELKKKPLQLLMESYIAYPLLYLLVPVSMVEFFHTYKKRYIAVAIFLALVRVTIDARRTYLATFIMMVAFCAIIHRKDIKYVVDPRMRDKMKKFFKYSVIIVIVFGYLFAFISQQRSIAEHGEDESSVLQTMTYYYGASVQFFGDCVKTFKIEYTYGFSALRGFFAPIFGIFKLFGVETPEILQYANGYLVDLHGHLLQVSPTKTYNSFATCFFQFYCDGGVLGIVLLSFLFGFYAQTIYNKMVKDKSKRAEATYMFFYANIMMLSFANMETVVAFNFWPLVLVRFLYPKDSLHISKNGAINNVQDNFRRLLSL